MKRRSFILGVSGLALLTPATWANAQQVTARRPKVAILAPNTPAQAQTPGSILNSLLSGLTELGYVDRRNVSFELRFAHDELKRLPALAAELVAGATCAVDRDLGRCPGRRDHDHPDLYRARQRGDNG